MRTILLWSLCFLVIAAGAAFTAEKGGVLRVAVIDEPPTLDQHVVTSDLTTMIAQHIFEGLYTFDSKYSPVPLLVKSEEMKDDGKTAVLTLREGVKFHNGKELDAEDVLASMERWGKFGARGPVLFSNLEKVEATGKYEVTLTFKAPFAPWKNLLAFMNGGPVIYPKDVASGAEKTPITPSSTSARGPTNLPRGTRGATSSWSATKNIPPGQRPPTVMPASGKPSLTKSASFPSPTWERGSTASRLEITIMPSRSWATSSTP